MKYILDRRYRFRGWHMLPCGLYDTQTHKAHFFDAPVYRLLLQCNAVNEIDAGAIDDECTGFLEEMLDKGIIREAGMWDFLGSEQRYRAYPARYREDVHWSITGACNFSCKHCFMSAPHAKHGVPKREQLLDVASQLAECGIFSVGLTGGEPLIRSDFLDIVDALVAHGIQISTIYTNGWLVDEALLDALETRGVRPLFQLSFDGVGWHDFLRGVPGAEERTIEVFKLLQQREYEVSVSSCLHRDSAPTLRETVKLLASLSVRSMKCGAPSVAGEWAQPEAVALQLSTNEEFELFERYIPQYFEDDAPLAIMLSGVFAYAPGDEDWHITYMRECPEDAEATTQSCNVLSRSFYIGSDGTVAPCMGMCDSSFAAKLPNLFEQPLRDILCDSTYVDAAYATVRDVRDNNPDCRACAYVDRCTGGCRNEALTAGGGYFDAAPRNCVFFKGGWEQRIRNVAQPAFEAYRQRQRQRH